MTNNIDQIIGQTHIGLYEKKSNILHPEVRIKLRCDGFADLAIEFRKIV